MGFIYQNLKTPCFFIQRTHVPLSLWLSLAFTTCPTPGNTTGRYVRALVLANRLDYVDLDALLGRHWREVLPPALAQPHVQRLAVSTLIYIMVI